MMHIRIYACWLLLYFHLHHLCLAFNRVFYQTLLMHPSLWHLHAGKEEKKLKYIGKANICDNMDIFMVAFLLV